MFEKKKVDKLVWVVPVEESKLISTLFEKIIPSSFQDF